ncbi:1-aminocyclopropane-1-carboxylate synthase-like protein 1 isoform X2 [Dendropsophus ebraccatus]|uniref:1-aminocyclopropane-1-carboxylate synthase-like protein 1 isoform X2 n=1 Tax=Dendropsophus ebraccatus TaxID=150705 RepID=UPI0038310AAB
MEALSVRGEELGSEADLMEQGLDLCSQDPYDRLRNPQGYISAGFAENRVCLDLMKKKLLRSYMNCLEPSLLKINSPMGIKSLREETACFLTHYCHSPAPLDPENIIIMNGCAPIMCALSAAICDPGDGFLTPTPYYSRLALYTGAYSGLQPVCVPLDSQVTEDHTYPFALTIKKLEEGMEEAKQQGITVKALILTNPHNPLGEVYSSHLLTECLEFASSLSDPERTHFVWGLSKDFGMSGLRVGVLYTQNKHVLHSMGRLAILHQCPGPIQHMVYQVLRDRDWLDKVFFPTNKKRLRESQKTLVTGLEKLGIPVLHRSTGIYVWADFRKFLTSPTFEAEMELWDQFMAEKLYVTPGKTFACCEPGWFRVTTSLHDHLLQVCLQKIKKVLQVEQETDDKSNSICKTS